MVESQPSKLLVASSILVSRSMFSTTCKDSEFHAVTPFTPFSLLNPLWIAVFEKLGSEEATFFPFDHLGFKLRYGLDFLIKVAN